MIANLKRIIESELCVNAWIIQRVGFGAVIIVLVAIILVQLANIFSSPIDRKLAECRAKTGPSMAETVTAKMTCLTEVVRQCTLTLSETGTMPQVCTTIILGSK